MELQAGNRGFMARMSGVTCTRRLKEVCPSLRILILTVYEDNERIFGALKAKASGYLLKKAEPAEIIRAINEVKLGGAPMSSHIASRVVESFHESPRPVPKEQKLSRREEEILEELSKGYTTKEIASRFSISAIPSTLISSTSTTNSMFARERKPS
jgi:DNA-binding NarL/FixJ family response regulator